MNEQQNNPVGQSNELQGSPGIRIAPASSTPTNAHTEKVVVTPTNTPSTVTPVVSTTPQVPQTPPVISNVPTTPPPQVPVNNPVMPKKKKSKGKFFIFLLILIIILMGVYIYFDYQKDAARGECSPLVASDTSTRELDVSSSIVQELYDKVKTTVREDVAYHNFDDTFKLYLAYRQIPVSDMYESNCNLFNENKMSNFSCSSAQSFVPMAFSEEVLQREVRKLFGEGVEITNQDIVLGNSCFGGFQYIADRGEYVEGYCGQVPTTTYEAEKTLESATVSGDTITLREKVRYYSAEGVSNDQLQNGVYVHTFKLDNSYHYAYVNREIES